jgi:hypothetical protein
MIDLDRSVINRRENTPAGTLWNSTDGSIPRRAPPAFLAPDEDTSLAEEPGYPVLGCAPRDTGGFLDIRNRKIAFVERELAHQAQVIPAMLKDTGHDNSG